MTSEQIRQRSELLNTQVITRDTGKRLGVVKELLVDIDRREVVALGLRDSLISIAGMPRFMMLSSIQQVGDVILVDDDNVIEDIDVDVYSSLINSEVITETGELLGKVRNFKFNVETGQVASLIIASLGLPLIPDQIISTYELPIEEIVSSGPNRLIVFEGAEDRLSQLTVGFLERLGIGEPPWERDGEENLLTTTIRPENQLSAGVRTPASESFRKQPRVVVEEAWDEDDAYDEPEAPPVRQSSESIYYDEDIEEGNWSETTARDDYDNEGYNDRPYGKEDGYDEQEYADEYEYEDVETDAWADEEDTKPYKAPRVNIPAKTKTPEYEEEGY